jgi:S-adenosylmethionine/arginine decarboxylase-like enzyme
MSVHSWPETGYLALDAFMGREAKPELAIDLAKEAFRPARVVVKEHLRAETAQQRMLRAVPKKTPAREKARAAA